MWGDTISSMTKILYGGSVTAENAEDILVNGQVDGLLIGRASFEAASFKEIFYAIEKLEKTQKTINLKKTLKKAKENKSQVEKTQLTKMQPIKKPIAQNDNFVRIEKNKIQQ